MQRSLPASDLGVGQKPNINMSNANYDNVDQCFDELRSQTIGVSEITDIIKCNFILPSVLELGCGTGLPIGKRVVEISKSYLGIDNSGKMLSRFKANLPDANCMLLDMINLAIINGRFDFIYCWGSLCHLPAEHQLMVLQTIHDKLCGNGIFAFTSGEHEGQGPGAVGNLKLEHFSMGRAKYIDICQKHGLEFVSAGYCSGEFYLYQFRRPVQQSVGEPTLDSAPSTESSAAQR
jgi:SAM-dependent methyltransferase